jgi:hypothetical protein
LAGARAATLAAALAFGFGSTRNRTGPTPAQIGSFTASPNPVPAGSSVNLTASNLTLADPGSPITQVAFHVQTGGTTTLLGYGRRTSPGV